MARKKVSANVVVELVREAQPLPFVEEATPLLDSIIENHKIENHKPVVKEKPVPKGYERLPAGKERVIRMPNEQSDYPYPFTIVSGDKIRRYKYVITEGETRVVVKLGCCGSFSGVEMVTEGSILVGGLMRD